MLLYRTALTPFNSLSSRNILPNQYNLKTNKDRADRIPSEKAAKFVAGFAVQIALVNTKKRFPMQIMGKGKRTRIHKELLNSLLLHVP